MPLSEHEQKLLEQMERALYAEDPKFASQMRGRDGYGGPPRSRVVAAILAVLVGLGCIVAAVSISQIWLGAVGFAIMVAGVAWAFAPARGARAGAAGGGPRRVRPVGQAKRAGGSSAFMQRMENRWEDRRNGGL